MAQMSSLVPNILGSVVSTVIGKVFSGGGDSAPAPAPAPAPATPPIAPKPEEPIAMPLADDKAVQDARRRSIQQQIARRGRASTILTSDTASTEKLG